MSTIPEVLACASVGLECVVLSLVCNLAAGMQAELTLEEVIDAAKDYGPTLAKLIQDAILKIDICFGMVES